MIKWLRKTRQKVQQRPVQSGLWILFVFGALGIGGYLGVNHGWAWYHFWSAKDAIDRHDLPQAREHLAKCLSVWPRSASTHLLAARTARRAHQLHDSAELLETCKELGADSEAIDLEEKLICAERGDLKEVERHLLSCVNSDHRDSILILEVLTLQWMMLRRLHEADQYLNLWLDRQPGDREALVRRGWVRENLLDYENAIADYQKALKSDPERDARDKDKCRVQLAMVLVKRNRGAEAIRHLRIILDHQPKNTEALLALARAYRQGGKGEKAAKLLQRLLELSPADGDALGEMGKLALDRRQFVEAETWLRKAARVSPRNRLIVTNLRHSLVLQKKHAEAKKLADLLDDIRKEESRFRELIESVPRSPRDPDLRYQIGAIFMRGGLVKEALPWLHSALTFDPNHVPTHRQLAIYFEKIGNRQKAAEHREVIEALGATQ